MSTSTHHRHRAPLIFSLTLLFLGLDAKAQFYDATRVVAEGGMRFAQQNRDALTMSSTSSAGLRVGGSAAVAGGGIKVGSASSEVRSELNPLFVSESGVTDSLFVAGDQRTWGSAVLSPRNSSNHTSQSQISQISRGDIDQRLADLLIAIQPQDSGDEVALIQSKPLVDRIAGTSTRVLKFSDDYKRLDVLLQAKSPDGQPLTRGAHVMQLAQPVLTKKNNPALVLRNFSPSFQAWAKQTTTDESRENQLAPNFISYLEEPSNNNVLHLANLQTAAGSQVQSRFTILGFSKNPNPNSGKRSAIAAFATNNRTAGSITAAPGQTLADLAAIYGTTVQELMLANNISSPDVDISGLPLTIPADLSTVGYEEAIQGDTPTIMAQRYGMDLSWLLDLNALSDPNQILAVGTKIRIPGRRPKGSSVLPPAKPQPPELEYADYGAYTTYEVTYYVRGSLTPLFQRTLLEAFQ
jgi:LysM repeat protein